MAQPKPIPDQPTHCRRCSAELPLLRRYAGLCSSCLPTQAQPPMPDPTSVDWTIIARFRRSRRDGTGLETCVRVRCSCGAERVMTIAIWHEKRSRKCQRCRMRTFRRSGFNGY